MSVLLIAAAIPGLVRAARARPARHGGHASNARHRCRAEGAGSRRQRRGCRRRGRLRAGRHASRRRQPRRRRIHAGAPGRRPHHLHRFPRARARRRPPATCIWTPPARPRRTASSGYRASGVPGTVRGLEYASQKYGTKPWADLVAPGRRAGVAKASRSPMRRRKSLRGAAAASRVSRIESHLSARRQILRSRRDLRAARSRRARSTASRAWAPRISTRAKPPACWPRIMKQHGGLDHAGRSAEITRPSSASRSPATIAATTSSPRRRRVPAASASCRCWACWKAPAMRKPARARPAALHYMAEAMRRYLRRPRRESGRSGFRQSAARRPARSRSTSRSCARPSTRARHAQRADARGASLRRPRIRRDHALLRSRTREGNVGRGHLHAERRLRQQGHGHRAGLPAEQRDGRFRRQAGRAPNVSA